MPSGVQAAPNPNYTCTGSKPKTENVPDPNQISREDAALLEKVLGLARQKRTIQAADYLSVKHMLPKTRLHRTILLDNKSQARHLDMHLERLATRQGRFTSNHEINRRAFIDKQQRKQGKWKQQDEIRSYGMNFPNLRKDASRRASMEVLYRSPRYPDQENMEKPPPGAPGSPQKPLLPYMHMRRERIELLRHRDQTYITRLPTIVEFDQRKLRKYNTYCAGQSVEVSRPTKDDRFENILSTLVPTKTTKPRLRKDLEGFVHNPNSPSATDDADSLGSSNKTSRKSGSPTRRKKVTILFPSRTNTAAATSIREGSLADSKQLSKSAPNPKKTRIMDDLKNKDLRQLKKSYGSLRMRRERENLQSAASKASSEKSFSNTLQLEFTVESDTK